LRSVAVVYEDDRWVAVSKPAGMAVHGGAGETGRTLIDLIAECYDGAVDVHLAHRIDKETSGLVVLAKSKAEAQALQAAWDRVEKRYLAVVLGKIAGPLTLDRPLPEKDGRPQSALTRVRPLEFWSRLEPAVSLVEAEIVTGRTHQIRRHLAGAGHPVLMDDKHGQFKANKAWARALRDQLDLRVKHLCLHSWRAVLPRSDGNKLTLEAPWPAALTALAEGLRADSTPPERPA
jgi:23S rRNA pseudouridine955/2504/2580 synthase